jgi:hypothetical protein
MVVHNDLSLNKAIAQDMVLEWSCIQGFTYEV